MSENLRRRSYLRFLALPVATATILATIAAVAPQAQATSETAAASRNGDPGSSAQVVLDHEVELTDRATATSKTYREPDGHLRTVIRATPMEVPSGLRSGGAMQASTPIAYPDGTPTCRIDSAVATADCAGTTVSAGFATTAKRTVVGFDLSAIFRNSVVTEAGLSLDITARANSTSDSLTGLVVTKPWNTSTTWTKATSSTNWTTAGGDTGATAFSISNAAVVGYQYPSMSKTVSDWISGAVANNGLLLKANESVSNVLTIASANDPTNGPVLTVNYDYDTSPRASSSYFNQSLDDQTNLSVNLANGDLRIANHDLHVPGVGKDLDVVRSWSSLRQANTREFGNAWQLDSTEARVYEQNDGVAVILPGGTPGFFTYNGTAYVTPAGWNADLTRSGSTWLLKFHQTGETWTFTNVTGATYESTLTSVADRNGNAVGYTYSTTTVGDDSWPILTGITDSFGNATVVHSTASHQIDKITDATGRHGDYTITSGRLTAYSDLLAKVTTYSYDGSGYLSRISTPLGHDTKLTYDADGRISTVTRVTNTGTDSGPTWNFSYTAYSGSPLLGTTTVQDPNGHNTVYTRDTSNRVTSTLDANGHTHARAWSANNDVSSTTDGLSNAVTFTYDAITSNLTKAQAPNVDLTHTGFFQSLAYGDATHPYEATQLTTAQGDHIAYAYDTPGNLTSSTDDRATQNSYSRTYYSDGTTHTQTDSKGNVTTYGYTSHRLTSIDNPSPLGDETFTYDSVGRVHTHVDGKGQTTTYNFNADDRLTSIVFNASGTVSFTYDDDGNLTNRSDASGSYVFKFDRMERAYEKDFPTTGVSSVVYDGASNVTSYTDAGGTVNYGYDNANNVTSLAEPTGSCTGTVSKCTTFAYDNNNARKLTTYPNGVTQTVTFDNSGRQKTIIDAKSGATLKSLSYNYSDTGASDRALLQTAVDNTTNYTTAYDYDELDHLLSATTKNSGGTVVDDFAYDYDGNSNRTASWRQGTATVNYTYNNADQMTGNGSTWTHDNNGNLTAGTNGFAATYNDRDQSTSITQAGGSATSQSFADFGQHERTASGSTSFLTGLLGLQSQTTGGVTTSYTRDPGGNLVSMRTNSATYYYLFDNLGSVIALTNSSGAVAQSFAYDPYGQVLTTGITVDSPFKFAGGYYDTATKLYHFGDRYYDPKLGQWSQRDTYGGDFASPTTENRYLYANGDPINVVDPSGHAGGLFGDPCSLFGGAAALISPPAGLGIYGVCQIFTPEAAY